MQKSAPSDRHRRQYLAFLAAAVLLGAYLLDMVIVQAAQTSSEAPAWAAGAAMAVRRASDVLSARHESIALNNLDCQSLTYRLGGSNTMQTGCFTETAFGLLNPDSDVVIFNGTDEGLSLVPYWPQEALIPWPGAGDLLALDAASTGGSYLSLYRNPLGSLQDRRNGLLQLTAKALTAPAELPLRDPAGKQLAVNVQTMAFSDNGSWLVAETLGGSFVRINLATLDMTAFAPAFGSQGSPALLKSRVAVSEDGRYVAIYNAAAGSFKVYDLATCSGPVAGLQPQACVAYDYLPFVRTQIPGLQTVGHLRFVNDGLLSFEVPGSGVYELAPCDKITSLIDYLGLGDSYTSGEGAFDYLAGTDTADDMCHLSVHSYPLLLTHDLFTNSGGHSVACSGAVINDVASTSSNYRGQVRGVAALEQLQQPPAAFLSDIMAGYSPGYVAQQRFVQQYQPAATSVSVGGNDIGFGDILQRCVELHVSLHPSDNDCYHTYEDRLEVTQLIDRTVPRWTALYRRLLAEAPGTSLYVIGYPQIVDDSGDCALNVHLSRSELAFTEELTDYLNTAISQAAGEAGAAYVDISQALDGHRLCQAAGYDVAVNGLTAGTDGAVLGVRVFGKESYHPNALGQALIEQAILKQTHNLAALAPGKPAASGPQTILNVPKTGRTVNIVVPDDGLSTALAAPGQNLAIQADGARDGLRPNTFYSVRLDGPGGSVMGTALSDGDGNVSARPLVPAGTPPGAHTIDITGNNQANEPVDVAQPIYVVATGNDADGDGIPDILDTCPGAVNSGRDDDRDGIDDTCDNLIGSPASTEPDASQTGSNSSGGSTSKQAGGTPLDRGANTAGASLTLHGVLLSNSPGLLARPHVSDWPVWLAGFAIMWLLLMLGRRRVPKSAAFNYNRLMRWVRKGFVHLLELILLLALVGGALAADASLNLTHPNKLETWLSQSNVYSGLVTNALKNAQQSASNDVGAGRVSLSDPAVQQAVKTVFNPSLVQGYTETFLNANYAWLEGKTATPDFRIDLTNAKEQLARQVGQNVKARVAGLPACSSAQLAQLQATLNTDPLTLPCLPSSLTPDEAAAQATTQIAQSSDFLNHPVITASRLNPDGGKQSQPYYQRFSKAPKLYKLNRELPWIALGLALLSMLGIIFLASWQRRPGIRRVGIVLVLAGAILVAIKFAADSAFNKVAKKIFEHSNLSQVQQSLTDFLHRMETQLAKTDLWFGIAFLALGIVILVTLWLTRQKLPRGAKDGTLKPVKPGTTFLPEGEEQATDDRPLPTFKKPQPPSGNKRPPRLIQ